MLLSGNTLITQCAAPRQVNKDPFGDGWMVKLRLSDPAQVESLMDAKAYEQKCSSDDH